MGILINSQEKIRDDWTLINAASGPDVFPALNQRKVLLPLAFLEDDEAEARRYVSEVGIWLDSSETLEAIAERLNDFPVIALNFPSFADGRHYSTARELRQTYGYQGEIRAIGDVLRDQLCFLKSCGFSTFLLRGDQEAEECLRAFDDFSYSYTATVEQSEPLFTKRSA
jgi:uncharacterized protein (DUF934 family)